MMSCKRLRYHWRRFWRLTEPRPPLKLRAGLVDSTFVSYSSKKRPPVQVVKPAPLRKFVILAKKSALDSTPGRQSEEKK